MITNRYSVEMGASLSNVAAQAPTGAAKARPVRTPAGRARMAQGE